MSIGSLRRIRLEGVEGGLLDELVRLEFSFGRFMEEIRLELWKSFRARKVIEYQNEITGLVKYDNIQMLTARGRFNPPKVWTVHTNLLDPFSVIWGSTNRIVLREHTEQEVQFRKIRRRYARRQVFSYPTWGYISPTKGEGEDGLNQDEVRPVFHYPEEDRILFYDDYTAKSSAYTTDILRNTIIQHHITKYCGSSQVKPTLKRELEDRSRFEIYGFEELHPRADIRCNFEWRLREGIIKEWENDRKVDMSYVKKEIESQGYSIEPDLDPDMELGLESESEYSPSGTPTPVLGILPTPQTSEVSVEKRNLRKCKVQFWISRFDYEMIKDLQKTFSARYKDREWLNSDTNPNPNSAGPVIRFRTLERLPKIGDGMNGSAFDGGTEREI